ALIQTDGEHGVLGIRRPPFPFSTTGGGIRWGWDTPCLVRGDAIVTAEQTRAAHIGGIQTGKLRVAELEPFVGEDRAALRDCFCTYDQVLIVDLAVDKAGVPAPHDGE